MNSPDNDTITLVPGLKVGHFTHPGGQTGTTVFLGPEQGMMASGLVLGGGPASRELALLDPARAMSRIDALMLTGGSAFGLSAADGIMAWLLEQGRGFPTPAGLVPIVPAAAIFDLGVSTDGVRPDAAFGRAACEAASNAQVEQGRVGAGAGATAGSYLGFDNAVRTGIGSYATQLDTPAGTVTVGALAVANPAGDIHDPATGQLLAGHGMAQPELAALMAGHGMQQNTTLVAVATDAPLLKSEAAALSVSVHAGMARSLRPSHTPFDGDTAFVLSTGTGPAVPVGALAVLVQEVVVKALVRAALRGVPGQ